MEASIHAAILAAGRGERLRRCTDDLPKPLVTIDGEPLLVRQARALMRAGAEDVVAVINSETGGLIDARRLELPPGLQLVVRDTANSMETLFELSRYMARGIFVAATVDSVMPQVEIARFWRCATAQMQAVGGAPVNIGALGVTEWRGDERPLFVRLGHDDRIAAFGVESSEFVTAGVYCFSTAIFDYQARARETGMSALRQFLTGLCEWGMRLSAVRLDDVIDIDTSEDLETARRMLSSTRSLHRGQR